MQCKIDVKYYDIKVIVLLSMHFSAGTENFLHRLFARFDFSIRLFVTFMTIDNKHKKYKRNDFVLWLCHAVHPQALGMRSHTK